MGAREAVIFTLDNSVWQIYLRRERRDLVWLDEAVAGGRVGLHPFTEGELALGGAPVVRFAGLPRLQPVRHGTVLEAVAAHRPRGIGWVDAHLVVSAHVARLQLFTRDSHQAAFSRLLGAACTLLE